MSIMRNTPLGHNRGLTLTELAIVLAILAVIAAVIAPNVATFYELGTKHQISQSASYTLYIVEEGAQENVGMAVFGQVLIRYPGMMRIDDSKEVSLTFTPTSNVTTASNFTGEPTPEGTYYMVSDQCQFYSVMQAELHAVNFEISSTSTRYKEVSLTSETDWAWMVSPNTLGSQLLRVDLSTPVRVEGYEELVSRAVYSQQIQIVVVEPFNWRGVLETAAKVIGIIVGVGVIVGYVFKLRKRRKRGEIEDTKGNADIKKTTISENKSLRVDETDRPDSKAG